MNVTKPDGFDQWLADLKRRVDPQYRPTVSDVVDVVRQAREMVLWHVARLDLADRERLLRALVDERLLVADEKGLFLALLGPADAARVRER
jgi:hypothetical protein